jgi:hypothetical protein
MRPLPVLPLPILIAHLQRPTRSLISLDSVSVSDVTSNCIKKEEAIAKFALDPEVLLDGVKLKSGELTGMPEGIQCASAKILYEFHNLFSALFGSRPNSKAAADDPVIFFLYTSKVL